MFGGSFWNDMKKLCLEIIIKVYYFRLLIFVRSLYSDIVIYKVCFKMVKKKKE